MAAFRLTFFALHFVFFAHRSYIIDEIIGFDMQTIQKFQFGRIYSAPKSTETYELIARFGHFLTFRLRNPKTRDSWATQITSFYQADETGAFEEVLFSDGVRLRA